MLNVTVCVRDCTKRMDEPCAGDSQFDDDVQC